MKFGFGIAFGSAALLCAAAGCSSGGGFLGKDLPAGNIAIADAVTGQPLSTTADHPYLVQNAALRFSLSLTEDRFSGPYTVSIVKQLNLPTLANGGSTYPYTFNQPCFVVHQGSEYGAHANVVVFVGDNANSNPYNYPNGSTPTPPLTPPNAAATPLPGGDPCHSGELETAQISDDKGHNVLFYYEEVP